MGDKSPYVEQSAPGLPDDGESGGYAVCPDANPSTQVDMTVDLNRQSPIQIQSWQMYSDVARGQRALFYFLDADFSRAQEMLLPLAESRTSLYGSLGMGVLFFMKSFFTFDPVDIQASKKYLDDAIFIAVRLKKGMSVTTIYSRLSRIFSRRKNTKNTENRQQSTEPICRMEEEEISNVLRHADLVCSEAQLLRAILLIMTDSSGGWVLLMRESLNIRSSYLNYQSVFNKLATANASEGADADLHYKSGILLGSGLLNIMFSLLPPRVFQVFSLLGYNGSIEIGISQLRASADCMSGLRAPVAELALLLYYNVLAGTLAARRGKEYEKSDNNIRLLLKNLLGERLSEHPNSPIYLYFEARQLMLQREILEATEVLDRTLQLKDSAQWPQILHACLWELLYACMYQLQWHRCYELATVLTRENRWSVCFSTFLEAIFLSAGEDQKAGDTGKRQQILELLARVPKLQKKIAGRTIPIEKYASRRATEALSSKQLPFYPEYELMLVWDGFCFMGTAELEKVAARMKQILAGELSFECKAMVLLIQSAIERAQLRQMDAVEAIKGALSLVKYLPKDSYVFPLAHVEWAQVALDGKDLNAARTHYAASLGYGIRYVLSPALRLRQAKVKAAIDRLASGHDY